MILTAQQPAYLPWLGLFHKIALSDTYVALDNVQFEKNSFSNRNKIKTAQGPLWLTVPVKLRGHTKSTIRETEIDNSKHWQKDHRNTLYLNYKKAPYFDQYAPFLDEIYQKKTWRTINELNDYMMRWFLKELRIPIRYVIQSELKTEKKKQELVLELCKKLEAQVFVFGQQGKEYAKEEYFTQEGIQIHFQDYKHPIYSQLYGEFVPYVSIIDLLCNHGEKSFDLLMEGNCTRENLQRLNDVSE